MPGHDIVTIGASAGGVEALMKLVRDFPEELPAAVFVVLHLPPDSSSVLPRILSRAGRLRASHAVDGERIECGRIYVAPPDRHLLLKEGYVSVIKGPVENRVRPAIDPLFRTAARVYGPRVIGALLSGGSDDGVAGLAASIAEIDLNAVEDQNRGGKPSSFSCPDCGGVLWELTDGERLHFRCRVGHAYTSDALSEAQR